VRPALRESWESLFHSAWIPRFLIDPPGAPDTRLERAIGVIYRPETERLSHYFQAQLAEQFDLVMHFDRTQAVEPLELTSEWEQGELPETYPFGV
jgi:erythromycin esterase-like protein